jgi:hypothetical protein
VYNNYLWYSWMALTRTAEGKSNGYADLDAQVRAVHSLEFDIRTVVPGVPPADRAAAAARARKTARARIASAENASLNTKTEVPAKPGGRRKKRVSKLQDKGEATGGGKKDRVENSAK